MNIISDIAGNYETLLALLKKMPDDDVLSVGDMIDRGPKSKQVVDWFMANGKALLGNHEHMLISAYRRQGYYDDGVWQWNGGNHTLYSYGVPHPEDMPENIIEWMEKLPWFREIGDILISHSFIFPGSSLAEACDLGPQMTRYTYDSQLDRSILWNRCEPERIDKYSLQICGHNSQMGLQRFADEQGKFAICLDDCRNKVLTGLHLPSMIVYQQNYID